MHIFVKEMDLSVEDPVNENMKMQITITETNVRVKNLGGMFFFLL